jgi:hypothetical protein
LIRWYNKNLFKKLVDDVRLRAEIDFNLPICSLWYGAGYDRSNQLEWDVWCRQSRKTCPSENSTPNPQIE